MKDKINIKDLTLEELKVLVRDIGEPESRAEQLFLRLYRNKTKSFCKLHNVSRKFLCRLNDVAFIGDMTLYKCEISSDNTIKYAFLLDDGYIIESVLIPSNGRYTLCISTQVGCAMQCKFCLTATMGFKRNLKTSEIVGQVLFVNRELLAKRKERINNIVFMGMGEPLMNFDNTIKAIDILQEDSGPGFSDRKITVSTCGLIPEMYRFAELTNVHLAISLHAADDITRSRLMPINKKYPLTELFNCCREISQKYNRSILIEYILLRNINDRQEDAEALIRHLQDIDCKINLIPYNTSPDLPYEQSERDATKRFKDILCQAGLFTIIRHSRGTDISAACGQLAANQ